jgi:archaeal flagellar protein FlaJ
MKLSKTHWLGIIFSGVILLMDIIFLRGENIFFFLLGIAFVVLFLPFVIGIIIEGKVEKEKNERFLEFARNLAENVKGGTPIGKSVINMSTKNFGTLTVHIKKLANQITLGIPISKALETFADDIGSIAVKRAIALIREAENAGGKIDDILDSVASSIYEIEKLKKERKSVVSNLVVQGYIIFFIFIGIMMVMQFKILPLTSEISNVGDISGGGDLGISTSGDAAEKLARPFLYLLLIQGVFSGLTIGKLAEGTVKAGVKHSFVMTAAAFLISTGSTLFF